MTYLLALILTVEQAFDCISTNLVISKGRGTEDVGVLGNHFMQWWQRITGKWWWTIKLPVVVLAWWIAVNYGDNRIAVAFLIVSVLIYAYILLNNYKVAWRQL